MAWARKHHVDLSGKHLLLTRPPGDILINSFELFHHSDDRPCLRDPSLDDFGWKVDDGVVQLNRPSSDFQIHSSCDEILVFNGTSIHDVLGDWCDVLSFNLSYEGIVILIVNKSLTSSQAVTTEQRTDLSAQS